MNLYRVILLHLSWLKGCPLPAGRWSYDLSIGTLYLTTTTKGLVNIQMYHSWMIQTRKYFQKVENYGFVLLNFGKMYENATDLDITCSPQIHFNSPGLMYVESKECIIYIYTCIYIHLITSLLYVYIFTHLCSLYV